MAKIFEDQFVDLQAEMIWACRDFYDEADKIYAYASNFDNSFFFNMFYLVGNEIKFSWDIKKPGMIETFDIGLEQIEAIEKLCKKYNKPVPTEMRMCYGIKTREYAADIKYDDLYDVNDLNAVMEEDIFQNWAEEVKQQLKS